MTALASGADETVGALVKRWRERRRRSQLDVSLAAEVSTRHLSYIETGRANPSREMIERLCDELDVPLRDRNRLHLAAGFAPPHPERPFTELGAAHDAIEAVLGAMEPNPAAAVDIRWDLVAANAAMQRFLGGLPSDLIGPPLNMLRATLHPDGLAPQIRNLAQWRAHLLRRVRRQLERTAAEGLAGLLRDLEIYGGPARPTTQSPLRHDLVVPLQLATPHGDLALLYTSTVFGYPGDVTLDEIAIETFFPADADTARTLQALAGGP